MRSPFYVFALRLWKRTIRNDVAEDNTAVKIKRIMEFCENAAETNYQYMCVM